MKVSIIIPVYNAHDFIIGCLQSVAKQSMTDGVECILVDDCGSDDSVAMVEQYISTYEGRVAFTLIHQDHNQGPSAARNAGAKIAQGEYIFYLDSDDQITIDCIDKLYHLAKKHDADYVQGTYHSDEHFNMPKYGDEMPEFSNNRKFIKRTLLNYNIIPFTPHNRLVRRQLIIEHNLFFNEQIRVREDFLWMTFMAKYVTRYACCHEETYIWGYNEDSLTHNVDIEREILGYRVLIETICQNMDPFERGEQKVLALDALAMAIRSGYYHNEEEKNYLEFIVASCYSWYTQILLHIYLKMKTGLLKDKVLHLLAKVCRTFD